LFGSDSLVLKNIINSRIGWYVELEDAPTDFDIEEIKPYLRPLSSMTQEECTQLFVLLPKHYVIYQDQIHNLGENGKILPEHIETIIDFYNSHHLDWRGLIPKGLALEAPKDMYKF
jgi:hypothetical protein